MARRLQIPAARVFVVLYAMVMVFGQVVHERFGHHHEACEILSGVGRRTADLQNDLPGVQSSEERHDPTDCQVCRFHCQGQLPAVFASALSNDCVQADLAIWRSFTESQVDWHLSYPRGPPTSNGSFT